MISHAYHIYNKNPGNSTRSANLVPDAALTTSVYYGRKNKTVRTRNEKSIAPLVIGDFDQLRAFSVGRAFLSKQPIILCIPEILAIEAFAIGEQINKDRSECGCLLGAQAMTAAFLSTLIVLMVNFGLFSFALLERLPIAIIAAVIFAVLGKVAGITMARTRARREIARILTAFTSR